MVNVNAQYRLHKMTYDLTEYKHQKEDPYNPALCGIASFVFPGLGQTIAKEPLRGFTFLGGELAGLGIVFLTTESTIKISFDAQMGIVGLACISILVVRICGITDAVKVAKVNNLTYREKKKKVSGYFHLKPFVFENTSQYKNTAFGATLNYSF